MNRLVTGNLSLVTGDLQKLIPSVTPFSISSYQLPVTSLSASWSQGATKGHGGFPHRAGQPGTSTLLADAQLAVVTSASLTCSSAKRCETISAKGNSFGVALRKSRAALRWRGSLDHDPKTSSCL